jgi:hypothetical protein
MLEFSNPLYDTGFALFRQIPAFVDSILMNFFCKKGFFANQVEISGDSYVEQAGGKS